MENWKTTVAGAAAFAVPLLNAVVPVLPPTYAGLVSGFAAFLVGFFAKDA